MEKPSVNLRITFLWFTEEILTGKHFLCSVLSKFEGWSLTLVAYKKSVPLCNFNNIPQILQNHKTKLNFQVFLKNLYYHL